MPATADWTQPRDWSVDELVTPALLNAQLRDNLEFLKNPPTDLYDVDESSDYTTTSTSFVDVDGTNLALTIETEGGDVMVGFVGSVSHSNGTARIYFELDVDGSPAGGDDGICLVAQNTWRNQTASFVFLIQGLSEGSHTIKLQWKTNVGTATLYAGAGTTNFDMHPQLWAREVS